MHVQSIQRLHSNGVYQKNYIQNINKKIPFKGIDKSFFIKHSYIKEDTLSKTLDKVLQLVYANHYDKVETAKIKRYIIDGKIALNPSYFNNLGKKNASFDATNSIPINLKGTLNELHAHNIEAHLENVNGAGFCLDEADDPIKTLFFLNTTLNNISKKVNRTAGMATMSVYNKNILDFVKLKKNENFNNWIFNLSVIVDDNFMKKVKSNEMVELTDKSKIPARKIYSEINNAIHYCGEPGILFKDQVEKANPIKTIPYVTFSPCSDLAFAKGESCPFVYINLAEFYKSKTQNINYNDLKKVIHSSIEFLDNSVDIGKGTQGSLAQNKRRIGLSVCGFANLLAKSKIEYGSKEAIRLLDKLLEFVNYESKVASLNLSKTRGAFPLFSESEYVDTKFIENFSNKNSALSCIKWRKLSKKIQKYGIRNSDITVLSPSSMSSRMLDVNGSIEPFFSLLKNNGEIIDPLLKCIEQLKISDAEKQRIINQIKQNNSCQNIKELPERIKLIYKIFKEIPMNKQLMVIAHAQTNIDNGIAKTVNLKNESSTKDISNGILYSHKNGLKGISFFRDGCLEERLIAK